MDDPNSATRLEQEIERQLRQTDVFVHRYLELIDAYGKYPECDSLIMPRLTKEFGASKVNELLGDAPWEDADAPGQDGSASSESEDDDVDMFGKPTKNPQGDRQNKEFEKDCEEAGGFLVSALLGWCNIYGMELTPANRLEATCILYLLSKTFSYMMQAFEMQIGLDYPKACVMVQRSKRFAAWSIDSLKKMQLAGSSLEGPFDNIIECLEKAKGPLNRIILAYRRMDIDDMPF